MVGGCLPLSHSSFMCSSTAADHLDYLPHLPAPNSSGERAGHLTGHQIQVRTFLDSQPRNTDPKTRGSAGIVMTGEPEDD